MDIYSKKSRWKIFLAIGGLLIVAISMVYTNFLATKLMEDEEKKMIRYKLALESLEYNQNEELECDVSFQNDFLITNTTIPTIWISQAGVIISGRNFGEEKDEDIPFLEKELEKIKRSGREPIIVEGLDGNSTLYYKNSFLVTLLTYFPIFQFLLIAGFIMVGYIAFNAARKGEQNRVWAGMAKETAHQLGTPISAIIGWIEHLKLIEGNNPETQEVVNELRNDVTRLELIADRFSKIGSAPDLEQINVYEELERCRNYMERRAPRKVNFIFPDPDRAAIPVMINPPLFDWVIENILRNALDAMDGKGTIEAKISEEKNFVIIDISDTGKGIPSSKHKTVFEPGFTTKKRGWGLGLSLAKRIVEEYHSGKIFVKKSTVKGTTFTIKLPKDQ